MMSYKNNDENKLVGSLMIEWGNDWWVVWWHWNIKKIHMDTKKIENKYWWGFKPNSCINFENKTIWKAHSGGELNKCVNWKHKNETRSRASKPKRF